MSNQRPIYRSVRLPLAIILIAACSQPSIGRGEPIDDSRNVLRFDAGPQGSVLLVGSNPLARDADYTPQLGYGWTRRPTGDFSLPRLTQSRSALTIDGVTGKRMAWQADIAPGDWYVTLWLESAPSDTPPVGLLIQGRQQQLGWQLFTASAEPRRVSSKTYRVFHAATQVGPQGLSIELLAAEQEVRLLGIALIRLSTNLQPADHDFLTQLESAGRHDSDVPLSILAQHAEEKLLENPADAFYAVWHDRLELLMAAERYFQMRGWQSADENTGLGMFDRLYQAVMLIDGVLGADAASVQPLAERAIYVRGRILYWLHRERGGKNERASASRDLGGLLANHPHDKILAMYAGRNIDLPDACDCLQTATDAPAWSVAEREALCRMRQIAHWWVQQQQADSGEFGGKFGDDVELLRWWVPLVLAGDRTALTGWERLANGVWSSKHIHQGYAAKLSDVEHAAEFVADTAPLMAIVSDATCYQDRLAWTSKHFQSLWTGLNPQGHRFFRSAWFSSTAIDDNPRKGRDLEYNTRAAEPMRYLAWRRPAAELTVLLHQWSTAWVSAAMRTDKGKPRGIIPASVRFGDEAINGDEPTWYLANLYWEYFDWQHQVGSLMLDQLLFTFALTNDEQLLEPMFLSLALIRAEEAGLAQQQQTALVAGSRAWAAAKLIRCELFWQVAQQWRYLTCDSRWDDLILRYGTPYGRYRISGDQRHLVEGLHQLLDSVKYNTPLMTSEAVHTDRVFVARAELLKAMLTGDGVKDNVSPYYAVSWEETDEDFTALVSNSGPDRLTVNLYSHAPVERRVVMRFWQGLPGSYQLRQEYPGQTTQPRVSRAQTIRVRSKGERIPIRLPGQRETRITLTRNRES